MINDLIIILKKQIAVDEFWLFSRGLVQNWNKLYTFEIWI